MKRTQKSGTLTQIKAFVRKNTGKRADGIQSMTKDGKVYLTESHVMIIRDAAELDALAGAIKHADKARSNEHLAEIIDKLDKDHAERVEMGRLYRYIDKEVQQVGQGYYNPDFIKLFNVESVTFYELPGSVLYIEDTEHQPAGMICGIHIKNPAALVDVEAEQEAQTAAQEAEQEQEADAEPREYKYFMVHRPVSIGAQPADFTRFEDMDKAATGYYGAIWYSRPLTDTELFEYEMEAAPDEDAAPVLEEQEVPAEVKQDVEQAAPESLTVQQEEKPAKAEKKDPATEYTPASMAAALKGDDWKATASLLLGWTMRNNNLIMQAALEADYLTPEQIINYIFYGRMPHFHTFNEWKKYGFIVKRGEKAAFTAKIWKYHAEDHIITEEEAARTAEIMEGGAQAGDVIESGDYIMKNSYFFTISQVERIQRGKVDLPEDCKREEKDGREIISGNTKPIKERIKAAGYMWDRKNSVWYRPLEDTAAEIEIAAA